MTISKAAQGIIDLVHTEIIEEGGRLTQVEDDLHKVVGPEVYQRIVRMAIRIRDKAEEEEGEEEAVTFVEHIAVLRDRVKMLEKQLVDCRAFEAAAEAIGAEFAGFLVPYGIHGPKVGGCMGQYPELSFRSSKIAVWCRQLERLLAQMREERED